MNAPTNGNSTATSSPENHTKHNMLARRGAISRLGNRETVRIIRYAHLTAKRGSQVSIQWTAVQPG
jgi:hypothetical protein